MLNITTRVYTTNKNLAFDLTKKYMSMGVDEINNIISKNLQTSEDARGIFEILFSEIISELYIKKFWNAYRGMTADKKEQLINIIAEWYCDMGNIMGYCGIVLGALKEV